MKYEPEEYYHIYNRGANKGPIFFSAENYRFCLRLLEKYATKYKVEVLAYCLMPNHYHFLLRQSLEGSLQRCIQTLFNSYTQALNKERQRSGTLFEARAKARKVDSDPYVVQLCAYIHLNPVIAGLVQTPDQWEFSDYITWISDGKPCEGSRQKKTSGQAKNLRKVTKVKGLTDLSLRNTYFDDGDDYKKFTDRQKQIIFDEKLERLLFDEA